MTRAWIPLLILLATGRCQFSEDRYGPRQVERDELIGTWVATDFAIESLRDAGIREHLTREDHVIVLRPDGTCTLKATLDPSFHPRYVVYDSGCRWKLDNDGHQTLDFEIAGERTSVYFYFEAFGKVGDEVIIWQYATDPDAWRYLEFSKRQRG